MDRDESATRAKEIGAVCIRIEAGRLSPLMRKGNKLPCHNGRRTSSRLRTLLPSKTIQHMP